MENFGKIKKILIVGGFILVVIVVGYLIYRLFFKPTVAPVITPPTATTTIGGFPAAPAGTGQVISPQAVQPLPTAPGITTPGVSEIAQGGVTKTTSLTENPTLNAVLDASGSNVKFYDTTDGKFYRLDENGQIIGLSDKIFYNAEKITWSSDSNKAIIEYPDGSNITYNFATGQQIALPKHWEDFDYSKSSDQIVAKSIGLDPDNRWLIIANDDGSRAQPLELLGQNADIVYPSWSPNGQSVAMYIRGIDFDRQEVFFVGLNDENFKSAVLPGRGFEYKWTPQGDRLLYSVYSSDSQFKPTLWIVKAEGESIGNDRHSLGVNTWAEKCTFYNNTKLYCAVPTNLEEGAGAMEEMSENTIDQLYEIDTQTGLKKLIAIPFANYSMNNLLVSSDGKYLYFTDNATKKINKINLK